MTASVERLPEADPLRRKLGQFMTPDLLADRLAGRLGDLGHEVARVLDPGAGEGSLSQAVIRRWKSRTDNDGQLRIDAFEVDPTRYRKLIDLRTNGVRAHRADFISVGLRLLESHPNGIFTHVIMNPPYARMDSKAPRARQIKQAGLPATNLYAIFLALGLKLLEREGTLVAIVPRSFCNGPHFTALRELIRTESSVEELHLIRSRTDAFKGDRVLQENVIIKLRKRSQQDSLAVHFADEASFAGERVYRQEASSVFDIDDPGAVWRLSEAGTRSRVVGVPLEATPIRVSTGSVVDFRHRSAVVTTRGLGTVPLIHAHHVRDGQPAWPSPNPAKANSLHIDSDTARFVYPPGPYVVVRRFSPNEQHRRSVACIVGVGDAFRRGIAFENHVNVFHQGGRALTTRQARVLEGFLNSASVDEDLRSTLGSTQINIADLRRLRYPYNLGRASVEDL